MHSVLPCTCYLLLVGTAWEVQRVKGVRNTPRNRTLGPNTPRNTRQEPMPSCFLSLHAAISRPVPCCR